MMLNNVLRRRAWFTENATLRQQANLLLGASQFALKQEVMRAWPVLVKIDISPLCNLKCTFCVHARPSGLAGDLLEQQTFSARQWMSVDQFRRIVQQIGGRSMAVSLYYLGDPLVHPELDEMCRTARAAGLNVHISSNFSFVLSDTRLRTLLASGLTHLTVCVDGLQQDTYELTRVGGRIALVLDNLERLLAFRRQSGQRYPRVEVQFVKFQHNTRQLADAIAWCAQRGVDQFTDFWGNLYNYADVNPGKFGVFGPKPSAWLPRCTWPHFAMTIKYDGSVIPCCYYRVADQYRQGVDQRAVGNVFEANVWQVWNSPAYQQLRRFVSAPQRVLAEAALHNTFCDGCPTIFETDVDRHAPTAEFHQWEELYRRDERNRVVRRA
jgi:MoaA/NifB/PqqE/SkfB family radical SAM enzyme